MCLGHGDLPLALSCLLFQSTGILVFFQMSPSAARARAGHTAAPYASVDVLDYSRYNVYFRSEASRCEGYFNVGFL